MCFSWPVDFISSTVIQDEQRQNQISVKERASLASVCDYSLISTQMKTVRQETTLQVLLLLLPLLLSRSVQIFKPNFNT